MLTRILPYQESLTVVLQAPLMMSLMTTAASLSHTYLRNTSPAIEYPAYWAAAGVGVWVPMALHSKLSEHFQKQKYGGSKHLAGVILLNMGSFSTLNRYW